MKKKPEYIYFIANTKYEMNEHELNNWGDDGWELCTLTSKPAPDLSGIIYTYYFKKLKT